MTNSQQTHKVSDIYLKINANITFSDIYTHEERVRQYKGKSIRVVKGLWIKRGESRSITRATRHRINHTYNKGVLIISSNRIVFKHNEIDDILLSEKNDIELLMQSSLNTLLIEVDNITYRITFNHKQKEKVKESINRYLTNNDISLKFLQTMKQGNYILYSSIPILNFFFIQRIFAMGLKRYAIFMLAWLIFILLFSTLSYFINTKVGFDINGFILLIPYLDTIQGLMQKENESGYIKII